MSLNKKLRYAVEFNQYGFTLFRLSILLLLYCLVALLEIVGISSFIPIFHALGSDDPSLIPNNLVGTDQKLVNNLLEQLFIYLPLESLIFLVFFIFCIRQIAIYSKSSFQTFVQQDVLKNLRLALFDHILTSRFDYQENINKGTLVNNLIVEANTSILFIVAMIEFFCGIIVVGLYLGVMGFLSIQLLFVGIILLALACALSMIWIIKSAAESRNLVKANNALSDFFMQRIRSLRLVNLAGSDDFEKRLIADKTNQIKNSFIRNAKLQFKTENSIEPMVIGSLLILLYIGRQIFEVDWVTVGLFLVLMVRTLPLFKALVSNYQKTNRYLGSVESIVAISEELKLNTRELEGIQDFTPSFKSIQIKSVGYRYTDSPAFAVWDINCAINKGEVIVIVGPSGSGKSTLVDLISGLRAPSLGNIFIDEYDITHYSREQLKSLIGYVPQKVELLGDTMEEHIMFGSIDRVNGPEFAEVLHYAGLSGLAATKIDASKVSLGESGVALSGGQKQRLDFARVLYSNVSILFLDEPASGLDGDAKTKLLEAIRYASNQLNRTIIMITQDLSDCVWADRVWVMNEGKLVCSGAHEELLQSESQYAKIWAEHEARSVSDSYES